MTQIGTGVRVALTLGVLQLAACSSTAATNRVDDLQKDGGGAASGSGGSGGGGGSTSTGGYMVHGGLVRCGFNRRSCSYGVVYEVKPDNLFGPGFPCEHPVSTCPHGCNPDWKESDPAIPICNPRPPGCDDAGRCPVDGGSRYDVGVSDWWECPAHLFSCREGVVYDIFSAGRVPPGTGCEPHPVSTCPYGCNPEWKSEDLQSPICTAPPPGCDDAGNCPDAGNQPGSKPPDAGDAARD